MELHFLTSFKAHSVTFLDEKAALNYFLAKDAFPVRQNILGVDAVVRQ